MISLRGRRGTTTLFLASEVGPPSSFFITVVMDSTYPLRDAAAGHRRMEEGAHIGKIVLVV